MPSWSYILNFNIFLTGIHRNLLELVTKLLLESFTNSDYMTKIYSRKPENPYYPLLFEIIVRGSLQQKTKNIIIDFDNVVMSDRTNETYISCETLDLKLYPDGEHYWPMIGSLINIIKDVSPAYIAGYLLSNKKNDELLNFRNFLK